jgi:hypothetical protein
MHGGAQSGQRLGRGVLTQHRLGRIATHHQGHGKDHEREQDQRQQRPPIRPAIIRKTRRSTMRYSPPAGMAAVSLRSGSCRTPVLPRTFRTLW